MLLDGNDVINGDSGDNTLLGGNGNNILYGYGGSDVLVIDNQGGIDTIPEFSFGSDVIGLRDGITFDTLTITQGNGAAILSFEGRAIAAVSGATPNQLNADDFVAFDF